MNQPNFKSSLFRFFVKNFIKLTFPLIVYTILSFQCTVFLSFSVHTLFFFYHKQTCCISSVWNMMSDEQQKVAITIFPFSSLLTMLFHGYECSHGTFPLMWKKNVNTLNLFLSSLHSIYILIHWESFSKADNFIFAAENVKYI